MKRAIFKMGRECTLVTQSDNKAYEVNIRPSWMTSDSWKLEAIRHTRLPSNGTRITIRRLRKEISNQFSKTGHFLNDLALCIARAYTHIIGKGFSVYLNGRRIEPDAVKFMAREISTTSRRSAISPYIFRGRIHSVDTTVIIGLWRRMPSEDEIEAEKQLRRTRNDAGITIICNDRVVLDRDKTRVTGWGEMGVPSFHNQFMAIAGLVEFQSNDAWSLPVTTTKRGIDGTSPVFLVTKDYIREGIKKFTSFTNDWKGHAPERDELYEAAVSYEPKEVKHLKLSGKWGDTRKGKAVEKGRKFVPSLPSPRGAKAKEVWIRFHRKRSDIQKLGQELLGDPEAKPGDVGNECFERTLKRVKK